MGLAPHRRAAADPHVTPELPDEGSPTAGWRHVCRPFRPREGREPRARTCWSGAETGGTAVALAPGASFGSCPRRWRVLRRRGHLVRGQAGSRARKRWPISPTYDLPEGLHIPPPPRPSAAGRFALSPDGRRLAFVATDGSNRVQLWVRVLETLTAEPLAGTEGASSPFWSPDSRSIAFVAQNTLKKVDVLGGPPVTLSTSAAEGRGSWSESGVILFSTDGSSLAQVSALRGASSPATPLDLGQGERVGWPSFLPDGQHFLYSVGRASARTTEVYVGSLDPQEKGSLLLAEASGAMYAQGHVIFQRGTTLMAQAFDAERRTLAGDAVPIVESLDVAGGLGNPGAFSVSTTGVLAYQTDGGDGRSQLVWRDRSGGRLSLLGDAVDQISVALSPDGARVAVSVLDSARNTRDLWLYDVARGHRTQFTSDPTDELLPVWSPDGERLAYGSNEKGPLDIYLRNSTGVGVSEALLEGPGNKYTTSWSRDGFLTLLQWDQWICSNAPGRVDRAGTRCAHANGIHPDRGP